MFCPIIRLQCSVQCCDISYDFYIQTKFQFFFTPISFIEVHMLFMLIVFICAYWCTIQFKYQMMFEKINWSNKMDATSWSGTVYPPPGIIFWIIFLYLWKFCYLCSVFKTIVFLSSFYGLLFCLSFNYSFGIFNNSKTKNLSSLVMYYW